MSNYCRVIPRDLFNEANLLKCLGQLYIALEASTTARFDVDDVPIFDIHQSSDDGSIYVANLPFSIKGHSYHLFRPLNSRNPWPLHLTDHDDADFDTIKIFDDSGHLSPEMLALI